MKKGFTLVEVLAVVVVLSIIAVIVTPVVGHIIEDEKIKGAILSAYGYKESVDSIYAENLLTGNKLDGEYAISGDELIGDTILELNIGGEKPTGGYVLYRNSELQDACLIINGYQVRYDNNKFYSDGKGDCKNLTWAYYYTFDNEGKRSNIVYKESDIPSDWNYYYKVVFGNKKPMFMSMTESQLVNFSNANTYSSLKECELSEDMCLSAKKIDTNYQNGDFGYVLDYQRYSILKTAEEVGIAEQYMGAVCEAYENKYAYVLKSGSEDTIRSLHDTLEQCENSKGRVYYATDECVLSSGYFCRFSGNVILKADSNEFGDLGSTICSLKGYESKSLITSSFNKIGSCKYIKKQDLDIDVYSGSFATLEECNSYVNSISATTEAACVPYSGYASKYVTQGGSEWRYNYSTLEKCKFHTGNKSYYTCEPSLGYAVKIHTVSRGIPWDGDNTCEDLPNWLVEKDINSCTYDYINKKDIPSEDIYYGFKASYSRSSNGSLLYDTMDACLADNLTCVGTETTVLSKEIFINIPEKNMKIAYNNNYDSLKNTMNDLFGDGIEFSIQEEDEESGIIHTRKYSFYSTTNKNINNIISILGIEEYQEEDKVMTLLMNAAYNDSIAFIANEEPICYLGIYGNFYISYLNQFMISKLSKQFHIELDNDAVPILIDIPGSNDQIIYHNDNVKNVATLTSKFGTGKSISNGDDEATFFSMNGENINSIIDSYNLTNFEEIFDRVIEDNKTGIHKIAAAVKNGSNNLMLLNTKEYIVIQGTFIIMDTTNL